MSKIKKYNFEKYSIFDIQNFLEKEGYKVEKNIIGKLWIFRV